MCTAVTYRTKHHYFGRNLDLDHSYHETVTITPRKYPFSFRKMGKCTKHYALIGMAYITDHYPLYCDATNEKGLSMAALNFLGNADYKAEDAQKDNVTPFELIPWILAQCADVAQAKEKLQRMNLVKIDFSSSLPLSPLHWIVADKETAITVESVKDGLKIYENPVGVLTNNPPFDYHMLHLADFMSITSEEPQNHFAPQLPLKPYSLGMGAIGLPGDLSSASRFVRAAFTKLNSISGDSEIESISQFFHILGSVLQPRGCTKTSEEGYEYTLYSSCCNTDTGIYYYKTYENSQITGVDMHNADLEAKTLFSYPLITGQQILMQNGKK